MAKSQLLKDFVKNEVSLETILLRLKVILADLQDEVILKWVNGELSGFKEDVPEYRILEGIPKGNFVVNGCAQYTNSNVPLRGRMSKEDIDAITTLEMADSINVIINMLQSEQRNNISRPIPTELCHSISDYELQITGMRIAFSPNQLDGIVSSVKSKILDIILLLEKNFENIDELDILSQIEENPQSAQDVIYNIQQVVFGHTTEIKIGDKNKIKNSGVGSFFRRGK
ncbi:hypothetical protein P9B03_18695 [Metasolibacillus meyeri]|uniref:AbiTii domain-containing protein n=1 Tax=Metasolibacillus meyeri TaxID=1071052 RepID=A0AAW9NS75_9BACL|nr:hypothetical protein [Metasolibacillus meyeri]MEC1180497.1 hypothetical protein [Metasolibacillus meyeri]